MHSQQQNLRQVRQARKQLMRNTSRERVALELQRSQRRHLADRPRNRAREVVVEQVELLQKRQPCKSKWNAAPQLAIRHCERVLVQGVIPSLTERSVPNTIASSKSTRPCKFQAPQRAQITLQTSTS